MQPEIRAAVRKVIWNRIFSFPTYAHRSVCLNLGCRPDRVSAVSSATCGKLLSYRHHAVQLQVV